MDRPGTAAVLSFIIPGLGQLYNGKVLRGIIWLIITPGLWIGSGGFLGLACRGLTRLRSQFDACGCRLWRDCYPARGG